MMAFTWLRYLCIDPKNLCHFLSCVWGHSWPLHRLQPSQHPGVLLLLPNQDHHWPVEQEAVSRCNEKGLTVQKKAHLNHPQKILAQTSSYGRFNYDLWNTHISLRAIYDFKIRKSPKWLFLPANGLLDVCSHFYCVWTLLSTSLVSIDDHKLVRQCEELLFTCNCKSANYCTRSQKNSCAFKAGKGTQWIIIVTELQLKDHSILCSVCCPLINVYFKASW